MNYSNDSRCLFFLDAEDAEGAEAAAADGAPAVGRRRERTDKDAHERATVVSGVARSCTSLPVLPAAHSAVRRWRIEPNQLAFSALSAASALSAPQKKRRWLSPRIPAAARRGNVT